MHKPLAPKVFLLTGSIDSTRWDDWCVFPSDRATDEELRNLLNARAEEISHDLERELVDAVPLDGVSAEAELRFYPEGIRLEGTVVTLGWPSRDGRLDSPAAAHGLSRLAEIATRRALQRALLRFDEVVAPATVTARLSSTRSAVVIDAVLEDPRTEARQLDPSADTGRARDPERASRRAHWQGHPTPVPWWAAVQIVLLNFLLAIQAAVVLTRWIHL